MYLKYSFWYDVVRVLIFLSNTVEGTGIVNLIYTHTCNLFDCVKLFIVIHLNDVANFTFFS